MVLGEGTFSVSRRGLRAETAPVSIAGGAACNLELLQSVSL